MQLEVCAVRVTAPLIQTFSNSEQKNNKRHQLLLTQPIHLNYNIPYYMQGHVGDQSDTE